MYAFLLFSGVLLDKQKDCGLGAAQNLWVILGRCNLKIEITKSPCPVYNSRENVLAPYR